MIRLYSLIFEKFDSNNILVSLFRDYWGVFDGCVCICIHVEREIMERGLRGRIWERAGRNECMGCKPGFRVVEAPEAKARGCNGVGRDETKPN